MIDLESFLDDLEAMLKANLNAQITAVANAKAASKPLPLPLVSDEDGAWSRQSPDESFLKYSPAVLYGLARVQTKGEGPVTAFDVTFFVEIYVAGLGLNKNAADVMLRYSRAVREVCEKYYSKNRLGATIKVETFVPDSFRLDERGSEEIRVGGVTLTASFV